MYARALSNEVPGTVHANPVSWPAFLGPRFHRRNRHCRSDNSRIHREPETTHVAAMPASTSGMCFLPVCRRCHGTGTRLQASYGHPLTSDLHGMAGSDLSSWVSGGVSGRSERWQEKKVSVVLRTEVAMPGWRDFLDDLDDSRGSRRINGGHRRQGTASAPVERLIWGAPPGLATVSCTAGRRIASR